MIQNKPTLFSSKFLKERALDNGSLSSVDMTVYFKILKPTSMTISLLINVYGIMKEQE